MLAPLIQSQTNLIAALDGDDVGLLEAALSQLAEATRAVRDQGGVRADDELKAAASHALALADAARARAAFLSDQARRRLEAVTAVRGGAQPRIAYTRAGFVRG